MQYYTYYKPSIHLFKRRHRINDQTCKTSLDFEKENQSAAAPSLGHLSLYERMIPLDKRQYQ